MAKEMSADEIENQIFVLRKAIGKLPNEECLSKEEKKRYYPLKNKIKNLEKQLAARRQFEFEAR